MLTQNRLKPPIQRNGVLHIQHFAKKNNFGKHFLYISKNLKLRNMHISDIGTIELLTLKTIGGVIRKSKY